MVFATLSSTQRKIFKGVAKRAPFRTVLIDEAGQSSEVAALQPLGFGARQVVLVGDPQQLPATILSEAAKSVAMERSLFERLQSQGCPVTLLTVQYRMHPDIRSFPSRHFYENRLEDAASVTALPPEPYYSQPHCGPYHIFDVARGKEQRKQGGGSLSNAAEAELAACMYASLRDFLEKQAKAAAQAGHRAVPPTSVAVITPYREQRQLLRQTFASVCGGPEVLQSVAIETVDSYQGRQVDVVIFSCVRAGASGGLGFVNDVRRMNVAITRARRSLWILGSISTLRANKEWTALIDDAEERGVVVHDAHAETMFPDLEYWQRNANNTSAGGQGEQAGGRKIHQQQKRQEQEKEKQQQGAAGAATARAEMMPKAQVSRPSSALGGVSTRTQPPGDAGIVAPAIVQAKIGENATAGAPAAAVPAAARTAVEDDGEDIIDLTGDTDDDSASAPDTSHPITTSRATRSPGGSRKITEEPKNARIRPGRGGSSGSSRRGGRRERSVSPAVLPIDGAAQGGEIKDPKNPKYPSLPTRR